GSEIDQATGKATLWTIKAGQQSLVADIANQAGNAYSFGSVGASAQAIEAEKGRVAAQLGFLKADGSADTDLVSTDSKYFSWSNVQATMNQAGLDAIAAAGPMAYGAHKINKIAIQHIEASAHNGQAGAPVSAHEAAPSAVTTPSRRAVPPSELSNVFRDTALPAVNAMTPRRFGIHFADGMGGSITNPDQPLRINAARRAVADAQLDAPLTEAMNRYIDRGPRGIDLVHKALLLDEQVRKTTGIDQAFINAESPEKIAAKLPHAEPIREHRQERASLESLTVAAVDQRAKVAISALEASFTDPEAVRNYYAQKSDPVWRRAIVKEIEWLADHGQDRFQGEIESYPSGRMRVSALAAGALTRFPDGNFDVYSHGTHGTFARQLESGQADLTGKFFVSNNMTCGHAYSVKDTNRLDPSVVGVAVPRSLKPTKSEDLYLRNGDIFKASQVLMRHGTLESSQLIGVEMYFVDDSLANLKEQGLIYPIEIREPKPIVANQDALSPVAKLPKLTRAEQLSFITDQFGFNLGEAKAFLAQNRECKNVAELESAYVKENVVNAYDAQYRSKPQGELHREIVSFMARVDKLRQSGDVAKNISIKEAVSILENTDTQSGK
ncbi:MAG: hypothetical protein ACRD3W_30390, partial [Terriglobales bacterium]